MATFFPGESHTFSEYLLVPGYSSSQCIPNNVSLKTPLTRFKRGEKPAITLNIPMVSAIMQSVSGVDMGVALATEGGLSFIYGSQTPESEAAMVKAVKDHKAGFVQSDSTLTPDMTMEQVIELKEKTGHSTMPVTDDGTPKGKLLGIVTSRDYRPSRDDHQKKVSEFMTPREQLIVGDKNISLKVANDVIWDNKLNALPIVDDNDHLMGIVFRKDYDSHKTNPNELLDGDKRYMVGAGINTRDYAERVPLLIEAGADVLCIDSSEGFSEWQKRTIEWIRANYGEDVKVGAGNVVDAEGFRFLADCGADFIKVGIGGGSICITRETKGIGRGQATALIDVCRARDEYYEETGIYVPVCSDGVSTLFGAPLARIDSPVWSMSWELWFSLTLPLAIWCVARIRHMGRALAAVFVLVFVSHWSGYFPLRLCLMFWIGVMIAKQFDRIKAIKIAPFVELAALILSVGIIELTLVWLPGGLTQALLMTMREAACLMIVLIAIVDGFTRRALSTAPILFLGKISYSLYLTHAIIIGGLMAFLPKLGIAAPLIIAGISLVICMGVAVAFWRIVEVPSMKFSRTLSSSRVCLTSDQI